MMWVFLSKNVLYIFICSSLVLCFSEIFHSFLKFQTSLAKFVPKSGLFLLLPNPTFVNEGFFCCCIFQVARVEMNGINFCMLVFITHYFPNSLMFAVMFHQFGGFARYHLQVKRCYFFLFSSHASNCFLLFLRINL